MRMTAKRKGAFYRRVVVALSAVALASAFAMGGRALRPLAVSSAANSVRTERVTIAVEGMYCDGCAAGIKAMLKRTAGVLSADVSYEKKEAVVEYDSQKITPEKIAEAINNLGYKAKVKN